jgi:hypothetical protein
MGAAPKRRPHLSLHCAPGNGLPEAQFPEELYSEELYLATASCSATLP